MVHADWQQVKIEGWPMMTLEAKVEYLFEWVRTNQSRVQKHRKCCESRLSADHVLVYDVNPTIPEQA